LENINQKKEEENRSNISKWKKYYVVLANVEIRFNQLFNKSEKENEI
jgi:hypothetical protein